MSLSPTVLSGIISDAAYGTPVPNLRVQLLAFTGDDEGTPIPVAVAQTNAVGRYVLQYAEPAGAAWSSFRLSVVNNDDDELGIVTGQATWNADSSPPPGSLAVEAGVDAAGCGCGPVNTGVYPLPQVDAGTQSTPEIGGSALPPTACSHLVGTVTGIDGIGLANVRMRLVCRTFVGSVATRPAMSGGTAAEQSALEAAYDALGNEFELARAHTDASGKYHLLFPAAAFPSTPFRGHGWPSATGPYQAWSSITFQAPAMLTLIVEGPTAAGAVDLSIAPAFSNVMLRLEERKIVVPELGGECDRLEDVVLTTTGTANDTEFGRVHAVLSSFRSSFYDTVNHTINPGFDLVDMGGLAVRHSLDVDQVAAYLVSYRLEDVLQALAARTHTYVGSPSSPTLADILSHQTCYGLLRMGAPSNVKALLGGSVAQAKAQVEAAGCRGFCAVLSDADLGSLASFLLDAGVGLQITTNPTQFRAQTLLASLLAGGSGAPDRLAGVGYARLREEYERQDWDGKPPRDVALSEFPVGQIWQRVQNNLGWDGTPWTASGALPSPADPVWQRMSDNLALHDLLYGVTGSINAVRGVPGYATPADMVLYSQAQVVPPGTVGIPKAFEGATSSATEVAYYQAVISRAQGRFQSDTMGSVFERDLSLGSVVAAMPGGQSVLTWQPGADDMPGPNVTARVAELRALRRAQSLAKIVPESSIPALLPLLHATSYAGPKQIASRGLAAFKQVIVGGALTEVLAEEMFARATLQTMAATTLFVDSHPNASGAGFSASSKLAQDVPTGIAQLHPIGTSSPNLQGFATYEPWRDAFSPLAYLNDLLRWLHERGARDDLLTRRPDIQRIGLSEINTFGTVAYLDLVLEVMEHAAANAFQPTYDELTGEKLETQPGALGENAAGSYIFARAYSGAGASPADALDDTTWPLALPFSLSVARTGAYLGLLRHTRGSLVRTLATAAVTDIAKAASEIGLSTKERDLFAGATDIASDIGSWGSTSTQSVPVFMDHFGISLLDLKSLVAMQVLHPTNGSADRSIAANTDFNDLVFADPWTTADVHRAARLLRLQRATGWSLHALDLALWGAVSGTLFTDSDPVREAAVVHLAGVHQLVGHTGLTIDEVASWFAPMDLLGWQGAPGLYEREVLNALPADENRGENPVSGTAGPLSVSGTNLVGGVTTDSLADALAGAFGITTDEFAALLAGAGGSAVTIETVSDAWRQVSAAKWLGVSIADFLGLQASWNTDIFATPASTIAFLQAASQLKARGLLSARGMVLLDVDRAIQANSPLGTAPARLASLQGLVELVDATHRSVDGIGGAVDPRAEWTATLWALLQEYLAHDDAKAIVDTTQASLDDATGTTTVDFAPLNVAIGSTLSAAYDATDAVVTVAMVRDAVRVHETDKALATWLSGELSAIPESVASQLGTLVQPLPTGSAGKATMLDEVMEPVFLSGLLDEAAARLLYLERVAVLAEAAGWDAANLAWFDNAGLTSEGFLIAGGLPVDPADTAGALARLAQTLHWDALERSLPIEGPSLASIWGSSTSADGGALAARLGLVNGAGSPDLSSLETLVGVALAQSFASFQTLIDAAGALSSLGLAPDNSALPELFQPTSSSPLSLDDADVVIEAVRGTFPNQSAWTEASGPIRAALKEQRRDALIAFHRHQVSPTETEEQLYERLLIDVRMSACGQTSRVKQALSATQQYIQRGFLRLEPVALATLTDEDREDWTWMKNYRVWEAARRVFLYPENWIRPELRSDKTPLFDAFEQALASDEPTEALIESSYFAYLEGLHEVSNLKVVGIYDRNLDGSTEATDCYVVARTHAKPHQYYLRERESGRWSPWVQLDVGLDGDHVMPVVFQGRLMVFWVTFEAKSTSSKRRTADDQGYRQNHITKVRFNWSIRTFGSWSAPKQSEPMPVAQNINWKGNYEHFAFRIQPYTLAGIERLYVWYMGCGRDEGVSRRYQDVAYEPRRVAAWDSVRSDLTMTPPQSPSDAPGGTRSDAVFTGKVVANAFPGMTAAACGPVHPMGDLKGQGSTVGLFGIDQSFVVPPQVFRFAYNAPFVVDSTRGPYLLDPSSDGGRAPSSAPFLHQPQIEDRRDTHRDEYDALGLGQLAYGSSTADITAQGAVDDEAFTDNGATVEPLPKQQTWDLSPFFHPYSGTLISNARRYGLRDVLRGAEGFAATSVLFRQALIDSETITDTQAWKVLKPELQAFPGGVPSERFEFDSGSAYGQYNWEIFFHMPMLLASRLREVGRYDEALRWIETVFDPNASDDRIWRFGPFADSLTDGVNNSLEALTTGNDQSDDLTAAMAYWAQDPFDAHRAARARHHAYRRWTVKTYVETLIEWADERFARYSIESINEARQLYVTALNIIGSRPIAFDGPEAPADWVVEDLYTAAPGGDPLHEGAGSDAHEGAEAFANAKPSALPVTGGVPSVLPGESDFFAVPANERLLGLWDTLEDRLFKIRHCLNLEGQYSPLPLFQPPIDPGLLVNGAALGTGLSAAVLALRTPLPHHRFQATYQRAVSLTASLRSLGGALLSALEKGSAEELGLLRNAQESEMLERVVAIREEQLREAEENVVQVQASRAMVEQRRGYYAELIETGRNEWETLQRKLARRALKLVQLRTGIEMSKAAAQGLPTVAGGLVGLVPMASSEISLTDVANAVIDGAYALSGSGITTNSARSSLAGLEASFVRRKEEWTQQLAMADKELEQNDVQQRLAAIRVAVAKKELSNQRRQMDHAKKVRAFMEQRFTNEQLYNWMASELKTLCFQSYQLALDMGLRAQACFRRETALSSAIYVKPGHWNGSRSGLLSGEKLQLELERMEAAYAEQDRREFELTKTISIAELDPVALEQLRSTGVCSVSIPEVLFDLDVPGHYLRRIRQVAVSVPCVNGPYTGVFAKVSATSTTFYTEETRASTVSESRNESIIVSIGQNDDGTFGQSDGRYQPFEYRGVQSNWTIELLDKDLPRFDHDSITDVMLTMRYTSREASTIPAAATSTNIKLALDALTPAKLTTAGAGSVAAISTRQMAPDALHQFFNPVGAAAPQVLTIDLARVPVLEAARLAGAKVANIEMAVLTTKDYPMSKGGEEDVTVGAPGGPYTTKLKSLTDSFLRQAVLSTAPSAPFLLEGEISLSLGTDAIGAFHTSLRPSGLLTPAGVSDILIVLTLDMP